MEPEKPNIEEQLREAIAESGLSNYQISDDSGVSTAQLSLFVNKKRTLTLTAAAKIAEALGMELKKQKLKKESFVMSGRKKPEAEKIQFRVSHRLSMALNSGQLSQRDYDYLWKWTHELYELALKAEK